MRLLIPNLPKRARFQRGMTLVEIMVASSLLLVILVGLMLMFNQTQKAFRAGLRQNDVLENGRAALDIIARDIEQMSASHLSQVPNVQVQLHSSVNPVIYEALGTGGVEVTNYLQTFFFMQYNGDWAARGYRVLQSTINTQGLDITNQTLVGTLYGFRVTSPEVYEDEHLRTFHGPAEDLVKNGQLRRIIDGVVHFKVTLYDKSGLPFTNNVPPEVSVISGFHGLDRINLFGSALPAAVDLELGILEPQAMDRVRSLVADGNYNGVRNYLANNTGKIHLFRRHIPIRSAVR